MQCPCGGDAKPVVHDVLWRQCDHCGRVMRKVIHHPLFDPPPLTLDESITIMARVEEVRKIAGWECAHQSDIIDAIREGKV